MSRSIKDARQVALRKFLEQIGNRTHHEGTADSKPANHSELDNLLDSIDLELTSPLRLDASNPADLTLNVGPAIITNTENNRNKTIPHIGSLLPNDFTSGTITFPATSGNPIVVSPGNDGVLTLSNNTYIQVLIYMDANGDLNVLPGVEDAVEADAMILPTPNNTLPIGYVTLFNNAGTIDALAQEKIYQFGTGAGGGGGTGDASSFIEMARNRLDDSIFQAFTAYLAETDQDDDTIVDATSTGAFDLVNSRYKIDSGELILTTNLLDEEYIGTIVGGGTAIAQLADDGTAISALTASTDRAGQSFISGATGTLSVLTFNLHKAPFGAAVITGNGVVRVYGDNGFNEPDFGNLIGTSDLVDMSTLGDGPANKANVSFSFTSGDLVSGTKYHAILSAENLTFSSNQIAFATASGGDVISGNFVFSTDSGSTWTQLGSTDSYLSITLTGTLVANNTDVDKAELIVRYDETGIDLAATYELSKNGGSTWETVTMEQVPDSDTFRGIVQFSGVAALDLRARVTSSQNGSLIEGLAVLFDQGVGDTSPNLDTAYANAILLEENRLGSTNPLYDRSVAGEGILLRASNGTLVEVSVEWNGFNYQWAFAEVPE
jgi:hypothetical protein